MSTMLCHRAFSPPLLRALLASRAARLLTSDFCCSIPVPTPAQSAILITGCSTGIGKHAALELAAAGYVVFAGVRKAVDGDALSAEAATRGCASSLVPVIMDVADSASIESAVETVKAALTSRFPGRKLAALVNNAGISQFVAMEVISDEQVRI